MSPRKKQKNAIADSGRPSRVNILFISAFHTPFIQDDIDTLSRYAAVKPLIGHGILQVFRIAASVRRSDIVFCWFASVYAFVGVFFGKLFGKKSIIVVGGVDVAKDRKLQYGIWLNPWKAVLVRYALQNADRVLAVDLSLRADAMNLAKYDGRNIDYLPTGYDSAFWKPRGVKGPFVLTIAVVHDQKRIRLKGIDVLIEAARVLPKIKFMIVGIRAAVAKRLGAPGNVTFLEPLERSNLLPLYQKARVYCQPSRREGLPNTLCEAMLCGCIPVATDVGGNPVAVGDTGFLVKPNDPAILAKFIDKALRAPRTKGNKARSRIAKIFARELREAGLHRLIREFAQ